MNELCLINCYPKTFWVVSPCLKNKGHKGKHKHEELCKNKSCMCNWGNGMDLKSLKGKKQG